MELLSAQELLQHGIGKEELLERFAEQLYRDFEMAGLAEFLPADRIIVLQNLPQSLWPVIEKVNAANKIQALLYRVDITEQQYNSALLQNENTHSAMAELVVKRVLQKVIFKLVYSR